MNAFYKTIGSFGVINFRKLRVTGKWMMKTNIFGERQMYIQHRSRYGLTYWIHENKIEFHPDANPEIFNCRD